MKKVNLFLGMVIALVMMSGCFTSCTDSYSDGPMQAPQKKDSTPDPQPTTDSLKWKDYAGTTHKVFYPESYVITKMFGLNHKGEKDSLLNRYPFVRSLKNDTTLYLKEAPESNLSYSVSPDDTWLGKFTFNAQNDSCATIYGKKSYNLSNGVTLTLSTERMTYYHTIDGKTWKYSEPQQKFGSMTITPTFGEFIRNDSIFGTRDNVCKTYTKLGTETFVDSCIVREIWFKSVVEKPEPHFDVTIGEYASFVAGSKCKVALNNWTDDFLFKGATKAHTIVAKPDANGGRAIAYNVSAVELNRVVFNDKVNGNIYDTTTGLHIPALITPDNKDKNGWFTDGMIDGRSVIYDPTKAQAVEEGIKNFVDKDTSVPTPFFINVTTSSQEWKEYIYVTITWSKYSKDTDMVTQTVTVKMPSK